MEFNRDDVVEIPRRVGEDGGFRVNDERRKLGSFTYVRGDCASGGSFTLTVAFLFPSERYRQFSGSMGSG